MKNKGINTNKKINLGNGHGSFQVVENLKHPEKFVSFSNGCFFYGVNLTLLEDLGFKTAAFWLKLKSEYINGTIYNYSCRKVSRIVGCSPSLAKKNIDSLISHGLIKFHGANLSMVSVKNIDAYSKGKRTKLLLNKNITLSEYKDKLALMLIVRKSNQQKYSAIKSIEDRNKPKVSGEIQPESLAIGMRKMANYLKISLSSLCSLIKKLKINYGLIVFEVKNKIGSIEGDVYTGAFDRYAFKNKKGILTIHYGSIYTITNNLDKACSY